MDEAFAIPLSSPPPSALLLQVACGVTLNEDSRSRLLACHTATHLTSSSHERLLLPSGPCAVAACGFSTPLLALSSLLLNSQRKRRKSTELKRLHACFSSSPMPHMLQVAVKGPQFEKQRSRRAKETICHHKKQDAIGSKTVNANAKNRPDQGSEKRNQLKTTKLGFKRQNAIKREKSI